MEFESILDLRESQYKDSPRSAMYVDLNVDQIIDRIALIWGENITPYYYYFPADRECEDYRRAILKDISQCDLYDIFLTYVGKMKDSATALSKKEEVKDSMQRMVWHVREVACYCEALNTLQDELSEKDLTSDGMKLLRNGLEEYLTTEDYRKMNEQVLSLEQRLHSFRFRVVYDKDRFVVTESMGHYDYEEFLGKTFPERTKPFKSPFMADPRLVELEEETVKILRKKKPEFFKEIQDFYHAYKAYANEVFQRLKDEIVYYLSFIRFERKMEEAGYSFCAPGLSEEQEMSAEGLYDLALACASVAEKKEVVSNDFRIGQDESFFVLTGPNQGGKTTFARSLGQLVYFTKMGLDVPAKSASLPYFQNILTHFSVEESIETGRGKLKEELVRLAPMMGKKSANNFVVINELFTTAANYDACIMGKYVLEHFIGQGCHGIYVTHLKELAAAHEKIVSIRAVTDEQGVRSFKIVRSEAEDSACAINQVNKYRLTYEQIKERLA